MSVPRIDVWTDGSGTWDRSAPACVGVHVTLDDAAVVEASEYVGPGTNQYAELRAIRRGLFLAHALAEGVAFRLLEDRSSAAFGGLGDIVSTTVHTDSEYAIGVLSGGDRVRAHDKLVAAIAEQATHLCARFEWVRGHAGVVGNEIADYLAHIARCRVLGVPPQKRHPDVRRRRRPRASSPA